MACNCNDTQGSTEINTSTCTTQPACTSNVNSACNCGCSPCQCNTSQTSVPTPFFNVATNVQECHTKTVVQQTFITTVSTGKAFNMPACGASITILIPGLQKIQVGSYLWNATYGYLYVVSFNFLTSQVIVRNDCTSGNAAAGTLIPACTLFNVVDPPFETDSGCGGPGVFVLVDFVVPAVSGSTNLTVSSVVGLAVGMVVQIVTGNYTVSAIVDATTITITNDTGSGGTPGATISAKDINGHCIAPVTPLIETPCAETPVSQGALIVCENGIPTTLDATTLGQVPVVVDTDTNEVQFQTLNIPVEVCTYLTACETIIGVGVGTTAALLVHDCTIFSVGDLVVIHYSGLENIRWVITNIVPSFAPPPAHPNEGHLYITSLDAVGDVYSLPELTEVCAAPCCDQVQHDIASGRYICDYDWSAAFKSDQQASLSANDNYTLAAPAIGPTPSTHSGTGVFAQILNTTCNDMKIMVTYEFLIRGSFAFTEGDYSEVALYPYIGADTVLLAAAFPAPAYTLVFPLRSALNGGIGINLMEIEGNWVNVPCKTTDYPYHETFTFVETYTLAVGFKMQLYCKQDFHYYIHLSGRSPGDACCGCADVLDDSTGLFTCEQSHVRLHTLGVAVQAA